MPRYLTTLTLAMTLLAPAVARAQTSHPSTFQSVEVLDEDRLQDARNAVTLSVVGFSLAGVGAALTVGALAQGFYKDELAISLAALGAATWTSDTVMLLAAANKANRVSGRTNSSAVWTVLGGWLTFGASILVSAVTMLNMKGWGPINGLLYTNAIMAGITRIYSLVLGSVAIRRARAVLSSAESPHDDMAL